ncbi:MAG TPA: hypothetical protein VF614_18305 [Chthoniobacteraceae bacterium]
MLTGRKTATYGLDMTQPNNPENEVVQLVINDVPRALAEKLRALAKREGRSRAAQVRMLLNEIVTEKESARSAA